MSPLLGQPEGGGLVQQKVLGKRLIRLRKVKRNPKLEWPKILERLARGAKIA
jgi:hypothetical protein